MEKKITSLFLSMLLIFVTAATVTGTQLTNDEITSTTFQTTQIGRAMWDLQFHYDAGGLSGSLYHVGVAFDGTYFYCPEFNSGTIYRFDHDGNYVDTITISGVPNLVDLTYDGTYVYGPSTTGNVLYEMDMTTQTLISQITLPAASYNVAYDADADGGNGGFWIGQWDSHLTLIDRSGATLDTITPPESMLGLAWDPWTQISGYNGPFLWIFTGTSTGGQGIIKVIDLDTKALVTGVEQNVALDLGMGIAGGLGFTTDWQQGTGTLYGMVQGAGPPEDYIFGYEVTTTNGPPATPATPDGPDNGATGVEYTFTTSTTDPEGEDVYYKFDWGDGTISGWFGPFASGATGDGSYIWTTAGIFEVRVKAKDVNGGESDWSDPHTIDIAEGPIMEIKPLSTSFFKVKATVKNAGAVEATDVAWSITLDGGAFIGKETTGTIASIPAGGEVEIQSGLVIGLGATAVTVTADVSPGVSDIREQSGTVLLFIIMITPGGG